MPPRRSKRAREDEADGGDDDARGRRRAGARGRAAANALDGEEGATTTRRGTGTSSSSKSSSKSSFAMVGTSAVKRPGVVRGMFDDDDDDDDARARAPRKPPPIFDDDEDEEREGRNAKRSKTVRSPGRRRGRSASGGRGETTDEEEDPLDAFMAKNDDAMDEEIAKTKEREEREKSERETAEANAEANAEAAPMEVTEEEALMNMFAAAGKAAARNGSGGASTSNRPIVLGVKKSVVDLRPVIPTVASKYVPVKKVRKASKKMQAMNDVFDDSDGGSESEEEAKRGGGKTADGGKEGGADEEIDDDDDEAWVRRQTAKLSKTERLGTVNHDEIDYQPVKKNFYIEAREIASMTKAETRALRVELDGIKCRGKKVPKPIKSWAQAGLSNRVHELIRRSGFEKPMPIQAQALPVIMSGRDCIGVAKTGSGKTLAYVLPMLRHINAQDPLAPGDGPIGMIMGPTRELVTQIGKDCKRFAKPMGFAAVSVYGGSGISGQITELKRGAEIVACTPGRMIDLLTTGSGKITNLRRVTYMVLDEADRMFDMGFEPQITRILSNLRPDRQTVMFSATFPHTMEALARAALDNPVEIQIGGKSVVNSDIEQLVEVRPEEDRFLRVLELLGEWYEKGKIIIFVATQDKADSTFKELLKSGYPCLSLHGGKEQSDRHSTISDFKSDVCNILVATSVAARGLDVKDLRLVINYDTPNHLEDYVHRVGRTGRAGQKGTAVTFISEDEEKFAPDLVKALKDSKQNVPNDVQRMADEFNRKRKDGLVGAAGSGFGGSGFKFNQEEQETLRRQKREAARAAGLAVDDGESDSEEEPVFGGKAEDDDGPIYASVGPSGQAAAHAAAAAAAQSAPPPEPNAQPSSAPAPGQSAGMTPAQIAQAAAQSVFAKLKQSALAPAPAQRTPAQLAAARAVTGQASTSSSMTPGTQNAIAVAQSYALAHGASAGAAKAAALAAALTAQHARPGSKSKPTQSGSHFETELEINDFPQFARYKVTQKDTLAQIMDHTGAAVTAKGQYAPPGRPLAPGDRKLYLLIEGPTERVVKEGKSYVKNIIEGIIAKQALPGAAGQPQGRYRV